jgi:hypothetical protein
VRKPPQELTRSTSQQWQSPQIPSALNLSFYWDSFLLGLQPLFLGVPRVIRQAFIHITSLPITGRYIKNERDERGHKLQILSGPFLVLCQSDSKDQVPRALYHATPRFERRVIHFILKCHVAEPRGSDLD